MIPALDSLFGFEPEAHVRRHGPVGYTDYSSFKPWLRDEFMFRCVYCRQRERWRPEGQDGFSVDHQIPQSRAPERTCEYDNLVYACLRCNSYKGDLEGVLDPCTEPFGELISIDEDGLLKAHTPAAEIHIRILRLNEPRLVRFRLLVLDALHSHYIAGKEEAVLSWLNFPEDVPNLMALRPPHGNTRPEGASDCFFEQRVQNRLPNLY